MITIHTTYNNPAFPNATMPSINLEEFGFTDEEMNGK